MDFAKSTLILAATCAAIILMMFGAVELGWLSLAGVLVISLFASIATNSIEALAKHLWQRLIDRAAINGKEGAENG